MWALVTVATVLYMTVPSARTPLWAVVGADPADLDAVAAFLWEEGISVTLAAHPLVPRNQVGFRAQIAALNSDEDIDRLNAALTEPAGRFRLRPRD